MKETQYKNFEDLSKEELIAIVISQQSQIETLTKELEELKRLVKNLQKDSSNSSKPPSTDIQKPNISRTQSMRESTGKNPGGQKGRKGITRNQTENPDEIIKCEPCHCEKCGKSLKKQEGEIKVKRQERDIPEIKVTVTEYQQIVKKCKCGHLNEGKFPEHIKAQVQIGTNAKTLVTYLNIAQLIPYKRLTQIAEDLFGFPLCEGSVENILNIAKENAKLLPQLIMAKLKTSLWVGSDETGVRVNGKRNWLWTWQNKEASYYAIEEGRGYAVVEKHFKDDYKGILVHDCWSAQNNTKAEQGHQQCHPHLQRLLKFLTLEYRSSWSYEFNKLLSASQRAREHVWTEGFSEKIREQVISQYQKKLDEFINQKLANKDELRLQKRINKHREEIFFFMKYPTIPFHNNDSEKAIRNGKVKQKISGGFRSKEGADRYSILLSVIETCKKQGMNVFYSVKRLLKGEFVFEW